MALVFIKLFVGLIYVLNGGCRAEGNRQRRVKIRSAIVHLNFILSLTVKCYNTLKEWDQDYRELGLFL